jgi:copper chaperone CopZ
MVTMQFTTPDMCCGGCASHVEQTIQEFAGVQSVETNLDTKVVTLTYDPATVDIAAVKEALANQGYPVQQ